MELSFHVSTALLAVVVPVRTLVSGPGATGGIASVCGRIMSISSCDRMWQCQTYSQPKLTSWLVIGAVGLPCGSRLLKSFVDPVGSIGLRLRIAFGTSQGTWGMIGRKATIVSSRGLTRMVSFQPSSPGSVWMMMLSQVTRFRIWTS